MGPIHPFKLPTKPTLVLILLPLGRNIAEVLSQSLHTTRGSRTMVKEPPLE